MGKFTKTNQHLSELKKLELPENASIRLHLVDVKARIATDIKLSSSNPTVANATINSVPYNGPKGIWTIQVSSKQKGKATIEAKHSNASIAKLEINAIQHNKITLPEAGTKEGILTRLFLAESRNPARPDYHETNVKSAMQMMRLVVENRLKHSNPKIFMADKGDKAAWSVKDIVIAPKQFEGFENYPILKSSIQQNIDRIVSIANDYTHPLREKYATFINNAIAASKNTMITDPADKGLYGWRTMESKHPGGSFEKYKDFAGQTFYTLKN